MNIPFLTPALMVPRLALCAIVVGGATAALAAPGAKKAMQEVICKGEFSSGSGVLGSSIGRNCFIFADTDQERSVQGVCAQNSTCQVRAMATVDPDGTRHLEKIISAKQISPATLAQ